MADGLCPSCQQLLELTEPSASRRRSRHRHRSARRSGSSRCRFCGCRFGANPLAGLARLALLLTAGALLVNASPPLLQELARRTAHSEALAALIARVSPPPDPRLAPVALLRNGLFSQLQQADQRWIPTSTPLPDGGTRYEYHRRPGDPELSLAEIKALIANPPDHAAERQSIRSLLTELQRVGVQIALTVPLKPGAAAEWDPRARTIRIDPQSLAHGTVDFLRLLSHETIHVAQSCKAGQLWAIPIPLGLPTAMPDELASTVSQAIATHTSSWELQLEREAYANQHRGELGPRLLRRYCPARQPAPDATATRLNPAAQPSNSTVGRHVADQVETLAGIAPLIVVPGH